MLSSLDSPEAADGSSRGLDIRLELGSWVRGLEVVEQGLGGKYRGRGGLASRRRRWKAAPWFWSHRLAVGRCDRGVGRF